MRVASDTRSPCRSPISPDWLPREAGDLANATSSSAAAASGMASCPGASQTRVAVQKSAHPLLQSMMKKEKTAKQMKKRKKKKHDNEKRNIATPVPM
eukprot:3904020-Pyramimonas_sp.AAC.1